MLHWVKANDKIAGLKSLEGDEAEGVNLPTGKSNPSSATDVANTMESLVRLLQSLAVCPLTYVDFPFPEHLDDVPLNSGRHSFDGGSGVIRGSVSQ